VRCRDFGCGRRRLAQHMYERVDANAIATDRNEKFLYQCSNVRKLDERGARPWSGRSP
jgi:hypothetical protein